MNSWAPEQYSMMAGMMQQMPPPLPPPEGMVHIIGGPGWNPGQVPSVPGNNMIGPVQPEDQSTMDLTHDDESNEKSKDDNQSSRGRQSGNQGNQNRDSRWNKRDNKDRDSGRGDRDRGRRPRSSDRNNRDRSRSDRGRDNRERVSRFGPRDNAPIPAMPGIGVPALPGVPSGNIIMPGMMPYGNNMMPGQAPMDMANMPHMPNMPNGPQMIPGMGIHPNVMGNMVPGMMPGMVDQSLLIAQQQMQIMSHPIFVQAGVLLPPIPGVSMPSRRDRPAGCRTIFVGGLPPNIGVETITEIFQRFGAIDDIKMHMQGVCHVRFMKQETVELSFFIAGFRFKMHDQSDNEATTLFIDYALNRVDQNETEKQKREPTPPRIEPFSPNALNTLIEKIKSDTEFAEAAPTLAGWLEKGECNKKNANTFYSLIQTCNNQVRRLYNEKMSVDEEFLNLKTSMKEKFQHILFQFEQVAKILSAAKHKRTSDHFSKQQRRNIEMWLKMTEDLENLKEEFNMLFDDEETDKISQKLVSAEKYEQLKVENDTLICELEGYRNEAHMAKDEAERKFEKFKAHYIAQQALHSGRPPQQSQGIFPPLPPPPPMPGMDIMRAPPTPDEIKFMSQGAKQEAKLVAMLTAFLLAHPLGATIDYLASYVKSMVPNVTQASVNNVLVKYGDIFSRQAKDKWTFVLFDIVKQEGH